MDAMIWLLLFNVVTKLQAGLSISGGYNQYLVSMNNESGGPFILNHLISISVGKFLQLKK